MSNVTWPGKRTKPGKDGKPCRPTETRLDYNRGRNEYTSISRKTCPSHKSRVREKMLTELASFPKLGGGLHAV
jgi:hypothetical protein